MEGRRPRPAPSATARLEPPCRDGEGMGAPSVPAQPPAPTWNLLAARAPATPPEGLHAAGRLLPRHWLRRARLERPKLPPSGSPGLRRGRKGRRPRHPPRLPRCPPARARPLDPACRRPPALQAPAIEIAWSMAGKEGAPATPPSAPARHRPPVPATPPDPAFRQPPDPARHRPPAPGSGVVRLRREGCLPSSLSPSGARGREPRRQRKELLASDVD
jgi:hypothetical protein